MPETSGSPEASATTVRSSYRSRRAGSPSRNGDWPRLAELALDRRQQLEVAGAAEDHFGRQYPLLQGFRHARPAVGADADNGEASGVDGRHEE